MNVILHPHIGLILRLLNTCQSVCIQNTFAVASVETFDKAILGRLTPLNGDVLYLLTNKELLCFNGGKLCSIIGSDLLGLPHHSMHCVCKLITRSAGNENETSMAIASRLKSSMTFKVLIFRPFSSLSSTKSMLQVSFMSPGCTKGLSSGLGILRLRLRRRLSPILRYTRSTRF